VNISINEFILKGSVLKNTNWLLELLFILVWIIKLF
jgi:hypothetical protein